MYEVFAGLETYFANIFS